MKFDCGETWEEKKARLENWHPVLAIFPIKLSEHDCRWLEFVERRGTYWSSHWDDGWHWRYRAKIKLDKPSSS